MADTNELLVRVALDLDKIEITPEMIEAGFKVLVESGITEFPLEADRLTVAEIFHSMYSARARS